MASALLSRPVVAIVIAMLICTNIQPYTMEARNRSDILTSVIQ